MLSVKKAAEHNMKKTVFAVLLTILFVLSFSGCMRHEHEYGEWKTVKAATCKEEGTAERACECGEKETKTLEKLSEHVPSEGWIKGEAADCTNKGSRYKECIVCEAILETEEVAALGHTPSGAWITDSAPTCAKEGSRHKNCSVCKAVAVTESIAKTEHTIRVTTKVSATSTTPGIQLHECTVCGFKETKSYTMKPLSSEDIYTMGEGSVAEIVTYDKRGNALSLGTAFVISSDGKLITNYHVINGAYSAKVSLGNSTYSVSYVLAYDKNIDLAIISINKNGLAPLRTQTDGIKGGAKVYAIGSSEGYTLSISEGIIASPDRVFDGVHYIQHNAAISHGNSGGPLFNEYGEVIGINTMTNIDGQNLNFAISCSEMSKLTYGQVLTLPQLYELECDALTLIKSYLKENGADFFGGSYDLDIGETVSDDQQYTFYKYISYLEAEDMVVLSIMMNEDCMLGIYMMDLDSAYAWVYMDDNCSMLGELNPAALSESTTMLSYVQTDLTSTTDIQNIMAISAALAIELCYYLDDDLEEMGVTAADLGFVNFSGNSHSGGSSGGSSGNGDGYLTDNYIEVYDLSDLEDAIFWTSVVEEDFVIVLKSDLTVSSPISLYNNLTTSSGSLVKIVFDGNGHTISGSVSNLITVGSEYFFPSPNLASNVTVKNLNIDYYGFGAAIQIYSGGDFLFKDVVVNCYSPIRWTVINMNLENNGAMNPANVTLDNVDITMPSHGGNNPGGDIGQTSFVRTGNPSSNYIGPVINLSVKNCEWIVDETEWSSANPMPVRGLHITHSNARASVENCYIKTELHPIYITSGVIGQVAEGTVIVDIKNSKLETVQPVGTEIQYGPSATKITDLIYTEEYARVSGEYSA